MPTNIDPTIKNNEGIRSQKLMLFNRGKAISGAPIMRGINQFPKPPISAGITTKKIIKEIPRDIAKA